MGSKMKVYLVYSCYDDYAEIRIDLQKIFLNKKDAEEYVELNNYQIDECGSGRLAREWFEYYTWEVEE